MKPASGRVLIADDEPHVRELLRDFLAGQGYGVSAVATGAQALDAVPTFQPDVILVDMLMPGLPGRDVLDALRRAGVTVPVLLMSGDAGLPYRKYHSTRHTFATWLLSDGADLRWTQQQLGHASIGQTADTYGHVQPDRHEAAVNGLDQYLKA